MMLFFNQMMLNQIFMSNLTGFSMLNRYLIVHLLHVFFSDLTSQLVQTFNNLGDAFWQTMPSSMVLLGKAGRNADHL